MKLFWCGIFSVVVLFLIVSCEDSQPTSGGGNNEAATYNLTTSTTPNEGGTISPADGEYESCKDIEVTAIPSDGWKFIQWEGNFSGATNPFTLTMNGTKTLLAVSEKRDYPLNILIEGEGAVTEKVVPAKASEYPFETHVTLTPVPTKGWKFLEWSGDLSGDKFPQTIQVDGEKTVEVTFVRREYPLLLTFEGSGSVKEDVVQQAALKAYPFETDVKLTAMPSSGWHFSDLGGDLTGTDNPVNLNITDTTYVNSIFEKNEYTLTTNIMGERSITTEILEGAETPDGFVFESEVKMTAENYGVWELVRWEGDIESTENPVTVTIHDDTAITAVFEETLCCIKTYGGSMGTWGTGLVSSDDGGYLVTGGTWSDDGIFEGMKYANPTTYVIKLDSDGNREWVKTYDSAGSLHGGNDIINTSNSNYGIITYASGDGRQDDFDIIKIDSSGNMEWLTPYYGGEYKSARQIYKAEDGGFVVIGSINTSMGDFTGSGATWSSAKVFVAKVDTNGDKSWLEFYGGSGNDYGSSIIHSHNGGYIITGYTTSEDEDFDMRVGDGDSYSDIFVIELDASGGVQWVNTYGGSNHDGAASVIKTEKDGYLVIGSTSSNDGDFEGVGVSSYSSIFLLKLDSDGNKQWVKTFGGSEYDSYSTIIQTQDGGYAITGSINSTDGDFSGLKEGDIFILKTDPIGNMDWIRTFGGSNSQNVRAIIEDNDGNLVLTGSTRSDDGDFLNATDGTQKMLFIKLDSEGNLHR